MSDGIGPLIEDLWRAVTKSRPVAPRLYARWMWRWEETSFDAAEWDWPRWGL